MAKKKLPKAQWHDPRSAQAVKLASEYMGQPTGFEGDTLFDYAFWLDDEQRRSLALRAVLEADTTGDDKPIITLLRSAAILSEWDRSLIADYLERNKKGKRGAKATPAYARSGRDAKCLVALARAEHLMQDEGLSSDAAFAKAEKEYKLKPLSLHSFKEQKIGSTQRMARRRATSPKSQ